MAHPLRVISVAAALAVLSAASGCATNETMWPKTMTPEQLAAISSVSVAESVSVPEFPVVYGPSTRAALYFLGPFAATRKGNPESQALTKMFADHGIDLGRIARQEFVEALRARGLFRQVDVEQADATFVLTIEHYALGISGSPSLLDPFNHPLRPGMRLAAKLSNRNGELLWQDAGGGGGGSEAILEGRKFEELLADPEYTVKLFRQAARLASRRLLNKLPNGCNVGPFEPASSRC